MKSVRPAGFSTLQRAKKILASVTAGVAAMAGFSVPGWSAEEAQQKSLTVLNYVTGWTHDAIGYHPAIFMLLENSSGRDLSNRPIRFQARFTDLHTAEVTIGRSDVRRELKPHQQFSLAIEGAQGYELPFELHQWPSIEAKAMCRVGGGGDETTETLTIAKLDSVARTTNEAFEMLNHGTSFKPHTPAAQHHAPTHAAPAHTHSVHKHEPAKVQHEKPLVATAESFSDSARHSQPAPKVAPPAPRTDSASVMSLLNSKSLPGLGDDFYLFEQRYGLPQSFDAKRSDWTWAKYKHSATGAEIIAGAKDRSGKVDVIVMKFARQSGLDESSVVNAAKQMSGKLKSQPLSTPSKSVRYLPSGRLELVNASSSGYKVVCMAPAAHEADNSFILVLSRVQQDPDVLLPSLASKSSLLKCLKFLENHEQER